MADTTLLSWINAEVERALTLVQDSIAKFSAAPENEAVLQPCPEHLHQVSGALRMVGLNGATLVCEAIEGSFAGDVLLPDALQRIEARVHVEQRGFQPLDVHFELDHRLLCAREQAVELIELLDFLEARGRRFAPGDGVQHLAQQRVAALRAAGGEVADLKIDAVAHHLRRRQPFGIASRSARQRIDQPARRPP